jgi:hypothetical protein
MIVRISANYEKMVSQSICGEKAEYHYDVIVYSADGRPMFTAKACSVSIDGLPAEPEVVVLVEAVRVIIEKTRVFLNTPVSYGSGEW